MDTIPKDSLGFLPHLSLEGLLASRARLHTVRLLSRLPEKEFTGRELARHLGLSHSTVQAAMKVLVGRGVATERRIGNACVYRANTDSVLLRAVDQVFRAEASLGESLRRMLRDTLRKTDSAGFVFGSVARDHASEGSDLDLLVVTRDVEGTSEAISELERAVARQFGVHLDTKIVSLEELKRSDLAYIKSALAEGRAVDPVPAEKVMRTVKDGQS